MAKMFDAVTVREYESNGEKKTAFCRIGAAFDMKNGGYKIVLDALPVSGTILLMTPKPKGGGDDVGPF